MRGLGRNILTAAIIAASFVSVALADGEGTLRKPPMGSLARQRLLKHRLNAINNGTLASTIDHNRAAWATLSPEEREVYRDRLRAFINDPEKVEELIEYHSRLLEMSRERQEAYRHRQKWLKVVVASFTLQERKNIQQLSPDQRAKVMLKRKAELVKEGKLKPDKPAATTQPTTKPGNVSVDD